MKSLFALDEPQSFKFITSLDGKLISLTNALRELLGYSVAHSNHPNIHDLLLHSSNYNDECYSKVHKFALTSAPTINLLLKFNLLPTLAVLCITTLNLEQPVLYGVVSQVKLPVYAKGLFKPLTNTSVVEYEQVKIRMYNLNDREEAIVYLMCIGLTQEDIAAFLGYTRGYIATMIAYGICPKFGLVNSSSKIVVKIALELRLFDDFIPPLVANRLAPIIL
jgi:hypothetical protein